MKETSIGSGIYEATYILPGGLLQYQLEGVSGKSSVDIGGIKFEVIVNPAKDGSVNVPTVYPKGVSE